MKIHILGAAGANPSAGELSIVAYQGCILSVTKEGVNFSLEHEEMCDIVRRALVVDGHYPLYHRHTRVCLMWRSAFIMYTDLPGDA